jgi:hypothetical protein
MPAHSGWEQDARSADRRRRMDAYPWQVQQALLTVARKRNGSKGKASGAPCSGRRKSEGDGSWDR